MKPHLWVRTESRPNERRTGLTPSGAQALIEAGLDVTVEESATRVIPASDYARAGCDIAAEGSWPDAPRQAVIFGLKELPEDASPLVHRHIMFGHAYKGQPDGQLLLRRFRDGGGTLYDLEYLVDETGRRVAAFGYWAGFAGAAVTVLCWTAQQRGEAAKPVVGYENANDMIADLQSELSGTGDHRPGVMIIGALGRVGSGAADLCKALRLPVTKWDMAETARGGPFPEILDHPIFLNCVLAMPDTPVFVPKSAVNAARKLAVIGDIACDPSSDFNPIPVYDRVTTWESPALRVHDTPVLDVTAIDNLPSMLPRESSQDFAQQLLPSLLAIGAADKGVWGRARDIFERHAPAIESASRKL